jgi:hypothetical protein
VKYVYNIQLQKADGSMFPQSGALGVAAEDTVSGGTTTPAAVNALMYAYSQAGPGSVVLFCSKVAQIDHDTSS